MRLSDGTPLSRCVSHALDDADVETVGSVFVESAKRLTAQMPGSDAATLQLGYLVGALDRGAANTGGIHAEIQRRVEQAVGIDGPR